MRWRAPGGYPAYSTYGIALAGTALEDVSGERYADYMKAHVFAPLGMVSARIMVRREDTAGVATPYALDDGKATRMAYEWYATPPASSGTTSTSTPCLRAACRRATALLAYSARAVRIRSPRRQGTA